MRIMRRIFQLSRGRARHARRLCAAVDATAGMLPDAPGWSAWLADVRGESADDRLKALGR